MYSPDVAHDRQLAQGGLLAFDEAKDFETQKRAIKAKLLECLGDMPATRVPLDPVIESVAEHETFTETRVLLTVEEGIRMPALVCVPKSGKKPYPVAICLQGHSTGMHRTMGRCLEGEKPDEGDRDMAIQALAKGYAALVIDQRCMGERRTIKVWNQNDHNEPRCHTTSMAALIVGRTMIGERCWDISRLIDYAETLPELDTSRLICMGNSGGGTATYYAAAFDERITVAIPSCAVCTFKDSIAAMFHCECNFIPGIAKYMDMGDMAVAIAPRPLIVVHGLEDSIFPKAGVYEAYETIQKVYAAAGAPDRCALVSGPAGHRFYKDLAWAKFDEMIGW